MKKSISLILVCALLTAFLPLVSTAEEMHGYTLVKGSDIIYGEGDTIYIEKGDSIHIGSDNKGLPDIGDAYYMIGWNPFTLREAGFTVDDDGSSFDPDDPLSPYGPTIGTENVEAGTVFTLEWFVNLSTDVFAYGWSDAKPVYTYTINLCVVETEGVICDGSDVVTPMGGTLYINKGDSVHLSVGEWTYPELENGAFYLAGWNPVPLRNAGFTVDDDGSPFETGPEWAYGPTIGTENVDVGTVVAMNWGVSESTDVFELGWGNAPVLYTYTIYLCVTDENTVASADGNTAVFKNEEAIPDGANSLIVQPEEKNDELQVDENAKASQLYDISVVNADLVALPVTGAEVTVTLHLPDELAGFGYYKVIFVLDGKRTDEETDAVYNADKNTITFTVSHFSSYLVEAFESAPVKDTLPGDVNGDGKVRANDARLVLRYSAGLETSFTEEQTAIADINKDGKAKAADARIILRISAGLDSIENYR